MNNVLSGIERDIVVSYLCDEAVPFTLVPGQPAEQIFSFTVGAAGVRMLSEGIILFSDPLVLPGILADTEVEVRFYFRKLGLSFHSRITRTKAGAFALVVPREIVRLPDVVSVNETSFSCRLFLGEAFSGDCLDCRQREGYTLFTPQTWRLLPPEPTSGLDGLLQSLCGAVPVELPGVVKNAMCRKGKALLVVDGHISAQVPLPFDGCLTVSDALDCKGLDEAVSTMASGFYFVSGGDSAVTGRAYHIQTIDPQRIGELLPLLPACVFLSEQETHTPSVQDRFPPVFVLYISSTEIVFATEAKEFPLQADVPYSVLLQVPLRSLRRSITLVCSVDGVYSDNGRTCACCRLSAVKAEDQRFLYESLNGRRFV